ncbi:MAG TPA: histidine kinase, partial [Burkholderiaceae bacterium]|nr:histidine kinase [Burkholderiaceae bacterium]
MASPPESPTIAPDLARCAEEPIRVPGAIQPHGRLLVVDRASGRLVTFSANWPAPAALDDLVATLPPEYLAAPSGEGPAPLGRITLDCGDCDASVHRVGDDVIVEFEPASPEAGTRAPIYSLARHFLPAVQRAQSIDALCE